MSLGKDAWQKMRSFYDGLSLARDGDVHEQEAFHESPFPDYFLGYEAFWRYHVAPATGRPESIRIRPNADWIINRMAQRSYSVFQRILYAVQSLAVSEDCSSRELVSALEHSGTALTLFNALERTIAGDQPDTLSSRLQTPIRTAKEISPKWNESRSQMIIYRDYLTHQGSLMTVKTRPDGPLFVLRSEYLAGQGNVDWAEVEKRHLGDASHWQELRSVSGEVVRDTLNLLNMGYEALSNEMNRLLENPAYQQLWGWEEEMSVVSVGAFCSTGEGSGNGIGVMWQPTSASSTSIDLEEARRQIEKAQGVFVRNLW